MKYNVVKFHSLRVTKHIPPKQFIHDYSLHSNNVSSTKYFGIAVTDDTDWGNKLITST